MSRVGGSARGSGLPGFILLGGFRSVLGMVYDCHLYAGFAVLGGLLVVRGGGGGGLWAVSKVESSARTCTSLSEVYPDWKLQ